MTAVANMRLSRKQRQELEVLRYWVPSNCSFKRITSKQILDYFSWSDRGHAHGRNTFVDRDGFMALFWAKNRRDLQITSYLEDWGNTMNAWSFSDMPEIVQRDIAKRMRKPAIMGCP